MPLATESSTFSIDATVQDKGRVEFNVPFARGSKIRILVIPSESELMRLEKEADADILAGRIKHFPDLEAYKRFLEN